MNKSNKLSLNYEYLLPNINLLQFLVLRYFNFKDDY